MMFNTEHKVNEGMRGIKTEKICANAINGQAIKQRMNLFLPFTKR